MSRSGAPGKRVTVTQTVTSTELILCVAGDLDTANAAETGAALLAATVNLAPPAVAVVDLTAVRVLRAAGVRVLSDVISACATRQVRVRLVAQPGSVVRRVLAIALPEGSVPVFDSLDAARDHDP